MSATCNGTLRYVCDSHHRRGVKHLVELDAYNFNGQCSCENFTIKLEPLLKKGYTPARAVAEKKVKLKNKERPQDALRCDHIVDAFMQFAEDAARHISTHEKKNKATPTPHTAGA